MMTHMRTSSQFHNVLACSIVFFALISIGYTDSSSKKTFYIQRKADKADGFSFDQKECKTKKDQDRYRPSVCDDYEAKQDKKNCQCSCHGERKTFGYNEGKWQCIQDNDKHKSIVRKEGCKYKFHKDENKLRTLSIRTSHKLKTAKAIKGCAVNNCSTYMTCRGAWMRVHGDISRWFRVNKIKKDYVLQITLPASSKYLGRIIKLGLSCDDSDSIRHSCLLFKTEGRLTCGPNTEVRSVNESACDPQDYGLFSTTAAPQTPTQKPLPKTASISSSKAGKATTLSTVLTATTTTSRPSATTGRTAGITAATRRTATTRTMKVTTSDGKIFTENITELISTRPGGNSADKDKQRNNDMPVVVDTVAGVAASVAGILIFVILMLYFRRRRRATKTPVKRISCSGCDENLSDNRSEKEAAGSVGSVDFSREPITSDPNSDNDVLYDGDTIPLSSLQTEQTGVDNSGYYEIPPIEQPRQEPAYLELVGPNTGGARGEGAKIMDTDEHLCPNDPIYQELEVQPNEPNTDNIYQSLNRPEGPLYQEIKR